MLPANPNFKLVTEPKYFSVTCYGCKGRIYADQPKYADLNGPSFLAYYCRACVESQYTVGSSDLEVAAQQRTNTGPTRGQASERVEASGGES